MHELGIVFHVIKSVEEVGRQNCLTRVSAVTLEIGEVSGVVPSYLTDCWDWAVKKSDLLRGAELRTTPPWPTERPAPTAEAEIRGF